MCNVIPALRRNELKSFSGEVAGPVESWVEPGVGWGSEPGGKPSRAVWT